MNMQAFFACTELFFLYSFLGWLGECCMAALRQRCFVNRGILNGPCCPIYGFAALLVTIGFGELRSEPLLLFLGSALVASLFEWISGHILEGIYHKKWCDYSRCHFHIDGYVCLQSAFIGGALGLVGIYLLNPLFLRPLETVPLLALHITLWVLLGMTLLDALGSYLGVMHPRRLSGAALEQIDDGLEAMSFEFGRGIRRMRMQRADTALPKDMQRPAKEKTKGFAAGGSFHKLFLIFMIGALLGDLVEMVFCRITAGVWMSRSSVVWGPFSIVWGLACVLATMLLYKQRERSDGFLFWLGTFIGGAYEYLCSVFTEKFFGKVFWDYSEILFNLGGRVNLLYCFFWGIAAVIWIKKIYPHLSAWIERIPKLWGQLLCFGLLAFMICNVIVSGLAMTRSQTREQGQPPEATWELYMDEHYGDERLKRIYPNAIVVN